MVDTGEVPSNTKEKPKYKEKIINKLFLVGNGFDLSLGLKTRYEDFLCWYLKKFVRICLTNNGYQRIKSGEMAYCYNEDDLLKIYSLYNFMYDPLRIENFDKINDYKELIDFVFYNQPKFNKEFKSPFFEQILNGSLNGWVDIEKIYYDLLKKDYDLLKQNKNPSIDKLNSDLRIIKNLIKEYLETLDFTKTRNYEITSLYIRQFISEIKPNEIIDENPNLPIKTNQTLFLNFNYTPTIANIIMYGLSTLGHKINPEGYKLNNIHGIINSEENDLVFGYGDEMDKDYKDIQDLNNNHFLENFKSFKYNHSSNYRDLLRFVNANDYQVCIYGHSCGLSDRVMLNEIFEHDNCKSIKIYYYNKEEFINKNMDISRHFNSNKIMRQRIVEFNVNDQIPQV